MDLKALISHKYLLSASVAILIPFFFRIFKYIFNSASKRKPLPPGPKPWPLLDNIPHLGLATKPHISITQFSKHYGPLISLKLGSKLLVIDSSPLAATQILKTQDRLLSARLVRKASPFEVYELNQTSIAWASCSDNWKALRTLCRTELFSAKAIEFQASLREKKVSEMVQFLAARENKVVDLGEVAFATIFNTLSNVFFSKDVIGLEDEKTAGGLKALMWRVMELGTTPNISDFYPRIAWLDLQCLRKKAKKIFVKIFQAWEHIIKERRESGCNNLSESQDFLDVFLANKFSDYKINILLAVCKQTCFAFKIQLLFCHIFIKVVLILVMLQELFSAGTDTTATTAEWAMAELIKNREVLKKVSEEIRREINGEPIKESRISQLPYLNACVKETLRLHPPVPFLLPHRALETCEVMDYTILKDSEVFVNVWAIGRDPNFWDDPLAFKPERFIGSSVDFRGHDYEFLPFGAGRRSCLGLPMASRQVPLILASLIHNFDWFLPNYEDPSNLDMNEKFGLTLQKERSLLVVPKLKQNIVL